MKHQIALHRIHEKLKKTKRNFYTQRSKTIDDHFVVVSYSNLYCSLDIYANMKKLNNQQTEVFYLKNSVEIENLFIRK